MAKFSISSATVLKPTYLFQANMYFSPSGDHIISIVQNCIMINICSISGEDVNEASQESLPNQMRQKTAVSNVHCVSRLRGEMKKMFGHLQSFIPQTDSRSSKALLLRKAVLYITELQSQDDKLQKDYHSLIEEQSNLQAQLNSMMPKPWCHQHENIWIFSIICSFLLDFIFNQIIIAKKNLLIYVQNDVASQGD